MTAPGPNAASPLPESAATPQPIMAPDPRPLTPWGRWLQFWFPKADPTTLAFIRVCTGLLVFYIHLAYSLDLQAFFGKHGWYASSFINRERHEYPSYIQPFSGGWNEQLVWAQLSDFPYRRQALMDFLRSLPPDAAGREMVLRYLVRSAAFDSTTEFPLAMDYVLNMHTRQDLDNHLKVLQGETVLTSDGTHDASAAIKQTTPNFLLQLPLDERRKVAVEVGAFWTFLTIVKWSDPASGRQFMIESLKETNPQIRAELIRLISNLPEDAAERTKLLDYLEYWNTDPAKAHHLGHGIFSVWFHVSDPTAMAVVHTGVLVVIFLFTIGLFTRVTSVLVWVATVGYIHRTQQVLFGMDTMMNILLIYLMIGNCGAALSVDRLISRYRAARASLRRGGDLDAPTRAFLGCPPPSAMAGFGLRLIQIHFCFIYMAAGLSKLKGAAWWEGRAFWDVIANPEFTLMPFSWYSESLHWLASIKPVYYTVTILACWVTLFVEISSPFLLWTRLRWFIIFVATLMHAIIAVTMGLNLFELLMIVMLIAFLPDRCIRDRFRGGADLPRLSLAFNPANRRQADAAALTVAVDVENQVALDPEKSAAAIALSPGPTHGSHEGLAALFRNLRFLAAIGFLQWVPGLRGFLANRFFPEGEAEVGGGKQAFKPPAATAGKR